MWITVSGSYRHIWYSSVTMQSNSDVIRKQWKGISKEDRRKRMQNMLDARKRAWDKVPKKKKSEIARKMALARWTPKE